MAAASQGVAAYLYNFDHGPHIHLCDKAAVWNPVAPQGVAGSTLRWASHGSDLIFLSGAQERVAPGGDGTWYCPFDNDDDTMLRESVQSAISSFARDGIPKVPGLPEWPRIQVGANSSEVPTVTACIFHTSTSN